MEERCDPLLWEYELPFAAWELRLYLNSHPHDRCALRLYYRLMRKSACGNYASIDLDCPNVCEEPSGNALDCMDNAACSLSGNLNELLEDGCCCECQSGDCCPLRWEWLEGPWPWEGYCPRQPGRGGFKHVDL